MNDQSTLPEALRQAADILAAHPGLPSPYLTASSYGDDSFYVHLTWQLMNQYDRSLAAQKAAVQQIVRAIGGKWDKVELGDTFHFRQTIGAVELDAYADREAVCERIVTGTETVTIAARPAEPERVEEREIVEWRCEPILAEAVAS